ncbi:uncharacterized protein LOC125042382 [Penaeus chinensis]|uniref:uncharacterized protein LOC125042382 n=1 Tax=Penaeus chinensis TaxID=139456 RepID=UPI001FB6A971|nr:uncharacterized protein LOC125042382 [Penaeus chinensis]
MRVPVCMRPRAQTPIETIKQAFSQLSVRSAERRGGRPCRLALSHYGTFGGDGGDHDGCHGGGDCSGAVVVTIMTDATFLHYLQERVTRASSEQPPLPLVRRLCPLPAPWRLGRLRAIRPPRKASTELYRMCSVLVKRNMCWPTGNHATRLCRSGKAFVDATTRSAHNSFSKSERLVADFKTFVEIGH